MVKTVAIIGAGIVGVSTAIWLQRAGHSVILVDRAGPGEGTSYGNGGVLAACACVPVTGPGLIGRIPRMLLDPDQPLFLKWRYLPRLLPWLRKYLGHANAADTTRITSAIANLTRDSLSEHLSTSAGTDAARFVVPAEYLFLYKTRAGFEADSFGWKLRAENGFSWDEIADVRAYDPAYSSAYGLAIRLKDHGRIADPGAYVKALAAHVEKEGGQIAKAAIDDVILENGVVIGLRAGGDRIDCDACVVATGVWSGPLAKKLGLDIPLETERGYHLDLWGANIAPKSPTMFAAGKFVATPMEGRLRLAGIVEFGGLEAPPSKPPFELLTKNALEAFPGLTWKRAEEWMGHRPAPADSIPVLGEVPDAQGVFMGFGHHHIGLTSGPRTGRLLAQMISGQKPNLDVGVYSPARFAKSK